MRLIPKNWTEFQQYKDRKPQWIKLHRELLNDFAYSSVQIGTKATLPLLWLLACEYEDGIIDASIEEISFRIHIDENTVRTAIDELTKHKFFTLVQDCTELYKTVPREEKRREEKEKRKSVTPNNKSFEISSYLLEKILSKKPNFKKPNLETWAKDIDLAMRLDKRSESELINAINWIYSSKKGEFWIPNILSAKKLREKYDTLEAQAMNDNSNSNIDKVLKANQMGVSISELDERGLL